MKGSWTEPSYTSRRLKGLHVHALKISLAIRPKGVGLVSRCYTHAENERQKQTISQTFRTDLQGVLLLCIQKESELS